MPQYDGSIRIVTKITTRDATESLSSLEWQIKKSAKYIDSLRDKMDALKDQKIPTQEYKELQKNLAVAEGKLALWNEELKKARTGAGISQINANIKEIESSIDSIKGKMQALEDAGKGFKLGQDTAEYAAMARQIQHEEESIIKAGEHYNALLGKTKDSYGSLAAVAGNFLGSMDGAVGGFAGRSSQSYRPNQKLESGACVP